MLEFRIQMNVFHHVGSYIQQVSMLPYLLHLLLEQVGITMQSNYVMTGITSTTMQ